MLIDKPRVRFRLHGSFSTLVVIDAHLGRSQSDCKKKSRDGLSTNQIAGFGGVVNQDGDLKMA